MAGVNKIVAQLDHVKEQLLSGASGVGHDTASTAPRRSLRTTSSSVEDYRKLIGEGRKVFKLKSTGRPRKSSKSIPVSVCKMVKVRSKYKKSGEYVEVRVGHETSYKDFAAEAAKAVHLESNEEEEEDEDGTGFTELCLFRSDGTRVPNTPVDPVNELPWTVHDYMSTFSSYIRTGATVKLGVGYRHEVWAPTLSKRPSRQQVIDTPGPDSVALPSTKQRRPRASSVAINTVTNQEKLTVKYAAVVGGLGLSSKKESREEVFREHVGSRLIGDFQPESVHYEVCCIERDGDILLQADNYACYSVYGDSDTSGIFRIVHCSPTEVVLDESGIAALYCIATNHRSAYVYKWSCRDTVVGCNSTVMWANVAGLYRCEVAHNLTTEKCSTHLIHVIHDVTNKEIQDSSSFHQVGSNVSNHGSLTAGTSCESATQKQPLGNTTASASSRNSMFFSRDELSQATCRFSEDFKIGQGAYGAVYVAEDLRSIGTTAAVKVLNESGVRAVKRSLIEVQLDSEIRALSKYRHPNLVELMGYCVHPNDGFTALVYEYLPDGSLWYRLHKKSDFSWEQRWSVLKDTCCALAYLHAGSPPLIHQDIKSPNILLYNNGSNAKVGDFGFALDMPAKNTGHTTLSLATAPMVAQTNGYAAPEVQNGKFSPKTDVYSYGIVVLEVYTGKKAYDKTREDPALAEHLEDQLGSIELFAEVYDTRLSTIQDTPLLKLMYDIVTNCLKRHSRRATSTEIMQYWVNCNDAI